MTGKPYPAQPDSSIGPLIRRRHIDLMRTASAIRA
jgi:hypothetical protein